VILRAGIQQACAVSQKFVTAAYKCLQPERPFEEVGFRVAWGVDQRSTDRGRGFRRILKDHSQPIARSKRCAMYDADAGELASPFGIQRRRRLLLHDLINF
jgi:hypothetical protein